MVAVPGGGDAELASVAAEANAVLLRSRDALGLAYHNHACIVKINNIYRLFNVRILCLSIFGSCLDL